MGARIFRLSTIVVFLIETMAGCGGIALSQSSPGGSVSTSGDGGTSGPSSDGAVGAWPDGSSVQDATASDSPEDHGSAGDECPTTLPAEGSSCSSSGQTCHLQIGASCSYECDCLSYGWRCSSPSGCPRPPPPSACPGSPPTAGLPCSQSVSCEYAVIGPCDRETCVCGAQQQWSCESSDCNDQ